MFLHLKLIFSIGQRHPFLLGFAYFYRLNLIFWHHRLLLLNATVLLLEVRMVWYMVHYRGCVCSPVACFWLEGIRILWCIPTVCYWLFHVVALRVWLYYIPCQLGFVRFIYWFLLLATWLLELRVFFLICLLLPE